MNSAHFSASQNSINCEEARRSSVASGTLKCSVDLKSEKVARMDKYLPYVNLEFAESGETMVNIRQSKLGGGEHIITVSGANLSPLMYQLKSIETSLIFGSNLKFQQPQQRVQDDLALEIMDSAHDQYAETSAVETLEKYLNLSLFPPPSPKSTTTTSTATKGYLRKRLRGTAHASVGTSTDDLEKSISSAVAAAAAAATAPSSTSTALPEKNAKKSETGKKKKTKKTDGYFPYVKTAAVITVDAATRACARVVWRCIEAIVKNRCVGCSKNLMDHHDVCGDTKPDKVRKFFNEALAGVDMSEIWVVMDEILAEEGDPSIPTLYPPKGDIETDKVWQSRVKKTILAA